jgi:GTP-binding protein HflX
MVEGELLVPYEKQSLLGTVHEEMRVLAEEYDEAGALLRVRAHPSRLERLQALLSK